jgi:hypothetical protein
LQLEKNLVATAKKTIVATILTTRKSLRYNTKNLDGNPTQLKKILVPTPLARCNYNE